MKQASRSRSLVALQVSHQMPRCAKIFHSAVLAFPFLHAVLAEVPYSHLKGFSNGRGWMRLRHPNQSDFLGLSPNLSRSCGDSLSHTQRIFL